MWRMNVGWRRLSDKIAQMHSLHCTTCTTIYSVQQIAHNCTVNWTYCTFCTAVLGTRFKSNATFCSTYTASTAIGMWARALCSGIQCIAICITHPGHCCECMLEHIFQTEEKVGFCWFGNVSANPVFNKSRKVLANIKNYAHMIISLVFTRTFPFSSPTERNLRVLL